MWLVASSFTLITALLTVVSRGSPVPPSPHLTPPPPAGAGVAAPVAASVSTTPTATVSDGATGGPMHEVSHAITAATLMLPLLLTRPPPLPPSPPDYSTTSSPPAQQQPSENDNFVIGSALAKRNNGTAQSTSAEDYEPCDTYPFCETQEHPVPDHIQLQVLQRNFDRLRPFFTKDSIDSPDLYRTPVFFESDPEFEQACEIRKWTINRPRQVADMDGNTHFLLNPEEGGYRQSIHLLRCRRELQGCHIVDEFLPMSRPTRCVTRFWPRHLTAINKDTLEPYEILVPVPATCSCYIKVVN